ncbi:GxxExxY protein [Blastomonas sp. UPD001]|jgi:GxxExxY protein|uniref:GxxExxY protein n=1 Tax=Blastomonas sp. UPD001 TaxID=2217673 RepID=UPI000E34309B|nr:GxxExxY protein [Blastomonas sp. UPD001]
MRNVEELASIAVDCGLHVHRELGPGLLESVYEAVLAHCLEERGLAVQRQLSIPISFRGLQLREGFKADIVIEGALIIEIKSVEALLPVHGKQLLTYLRLANMSLGLLMNFGGATFKQGLKRVVNDHRNFASSRLRVHHNPQTS